jgi:hypothetical protein
VFANAAPPPPAGSTGHRAGRERRRRASGAAAHFTAAVDWPAARWPPGRLVKQAGVSRRSSSRGHTTAQHTHGGAGLCWSPSSSGRRCSLNMQLNWLDPYHDYWLRPIWFGRPGRFCLGPLAVARRRWPASPSHTLDTNNPIRSRAPVDLSAGRRPAAAGRRGRPVPPLALIIGRRRYQRRDHESGPRTLSHARQSQKHSGWHSHWHSHWLAHLDDHDRGCGD